MEKVIKKILAVFFIITFIMPILAEPISAMTKKEIEKEIKAYEKTVELNYKAWKKEQKKYKQQAKGVQLIISGTVISQNPLIIQEDNFGTCYYIKSGKDNIAVFGSQVLLSYVKPTKQYQKWGIYNCIVATGVTVDASPDRAKKQYQEEKEELDKLYAAKNATIKIKPPKKLRVNHTVELDYEPANVHTYYTEVKIMSHSKNISAEIDKYSVFVEGLREGDAFLKLKCDSSGKTKTIKFKVYPEFDEVKLQDIKISKDEVKYQIDDRKGIHVDNCYEKPTKSLDYKLIFKKGDNPKHYKGEVQVTSSDENIIEVINRDIIQIKNSGNATVTISSGGISKEIRYCITRKSMDMFKELAGTYNVSNMLDSDNGFAEINIYTSPQEGKYGNIVGDIVLEINGELYCGQLEEESVYTLLINATQNVELTLEITWQESGAPDIELYEGNKVLAELIKQI